MVVQDGFPLAQTLVDTKEEKMWFWVFVIIGGIIFLGVIILSIIGSRYPGEGTSIPDDEEIEV